MLNFHSNEPIFKVDLMLKQKNTGKKGKSYHQILSFFTFYGKSQKSQKSEKRM